MNKPVIRMSNSGACPRALSAELLGYESLPQPTWLEVSAEEGKWHEQRIKGKLEQEGFIVCGAQREVILPFPSFNLVGHIDGIVIRDDEASHLLEIKSMSQFEFDRWIRDGFAGFPRYAAQVTCYMEALGYKECLYIVKNRSSGYEDRRILTQFPAHMTEIIARLVDAVNHAAGNILAESPFDPQSLECRRCLYKHLCVPAPKELTPLEKAELESAAKEWREGKALIEKGEALVGIAREAFEQHTKATAQDKWSYAGLAIQIVHFKQTLNYPKAKLLKVFSPEQLVPASETREAYDQLRITDLEANNARD